jgi:hypothetical protein
MQLENGRATCFGVVGRGIARGEGSGRKDCDEHNE